MKTSIIGFPRIGEKRELKKITENFIKKSITKQEFIDKAKKIKKKQWLLQKEYNLNFISSNDFSFYDNFLDTIIMLNAIPEKYKYLNLEDLDLYFAMAKGYQSNQIDVTALPMKKWFNTNYHYMVPEINKNTDFKLNTEKILAEYKEAKEIKIETKPVVIGPLTFLKLSTYKKNENYNNYIEKIIVLYKELIEKLIENGIEYFQIDEPILVTDLNETDINNFNKIYNTLLSNSVNDKINIILQTYFGDVRDVYKEIINLPFYAIGLDFVEGSKNIQLIKKFSFPSNKILFAGIINGKNIWKNNYKKSIELIKTLEKYINKSNIVLNTSCSLLHVPYTLRNENKLGKYKKYLSFAEEKLNELNELRFLIDKNFESEYIYIENQSILNNKINLKDFYFEDIQNKIKNLKETDFNRNQNFETRNNEQKKFFNLPLLPTTTIGSFPQIQEVRKMRRKYKKNEISNKEYEHFIKEKIKNIINLQEEIGLDVLVHGEYERNDMVEYFGENLSGFLFTENGWVQSYGTRGVKPPIIFGDVKREKDITVKWIKYAQSITSKPVKGMLTGPVTILNWSFPREDLELKDIAYQIGLAIQEEVNALEESGINIIQIDEAALREKLPLRKTEWKPYLNWTIKAFKLTNSKVKSKTQIHTHMCYSEFGDIINEIKNMDADVLTIEAAKSDLTLLNTIKKNNYDKEFGPGVYDIHSPRVPTVEELKQIIKKFLPLVGKYKLWINPDCGLKTREEYETIRSLKNMVTAVKEIRKNI